MKKGEKKLPLFNTEILISEEELKNYNKRIWVTERNTAKSTYFIKKRLEHWKKTGECTLFIRLTQGEVDSYIASTINPTSEFDRYWDDFYFKDYWIYERETDKLVGCIVGLNAVTKFKSVIAGNFMEALVDEFIPLPGELSMALQEKLYQNYLYVVRTFARNNLPNFIVNFVGNPNAFNNWVFNYWDIEIPDKGCWIKDKANKLLVYFSKGGDFNTVNNQIKDTVLAPPIGKTTSQEEEFYLNSRFAFDDMRLIIGRSKVKIGKYLVRVVYKGRKWYLCEALYKVGNEWIDAGEVFVHDQQDIMNIRQIALSQQDIASTDGLELYHDLNELATLWLQKMQERSLLFTKITCQNDILDFILRNSNYNDLL